MDAPVLQASCERRATSTTALQALTLLNDDFVSEQARFFAQRLVREAGNDLDAQIRRAFLLALGRPPSAEELRKSKVFVDSEKQDSLAGLCRILMNTNEFVYVD